MTPLLGTHDAATRHAFAAVRLVDTEDPVHLVPLASSSEEPCIVRAVDGEYRCLHSLAQALETRLTTRLSFVAMTVCVAAAGPGPDS